MTIFPRAFDADSFQLFLIIYLEQSRVSIEVGCLVCITMVSDCLPDLVDEVLEYQERLLAPICCLKEHSSQVAANNVPGLRSTLFDQSVLEEMCGS